MAPRVGLSICYDLRFPMLYAALAERGVDVVAAPAAFTDQTGRDHWHVLVRARAIETQAWVIAAAQWGKHPEERRSYGHSMIVDPWGIVVSECSNRTGVLVAPLDTELTRTVRQRIPCARHRRNLS
jgi:predicted amidohydrolase